MPIIQKRPTAPAPQPPRVQVAKPSYQNVTVDTRYEPMDTLLSHIEGSSWTVRYFSQVLNRDSGTAGQGLGTDPIVQQYHTIVGMEIRVTSDLTESQDSTTRDMTVTGTATLYPFLVPNKGDMFIADMIDGRPGIFMVTESTRLAIMREACHSIDYQLVGIGDNVRMRDLESKVVRTSYFERDFIYHGQNPILVADDYENLQFLRRNYAALITRYFRQFYSREYATLIVPNQDTTTYDGFLVRGFSAMLEVGQAPELLTMRRLNMDDDQVMHSPSLWDALVRRDRTLLHEVFRKTGVVYAREFTRTPLFEAVAYSGVKMVIYPQDAVVRVDNEILQPPKSAADLVLKHDTVESRRMNAINKVYGNGVVNTQLDSIGHHACSDGYYVFSKAFYENDRTANAQSFLELKVQDVLDAKEVSYTDLRQLVEDSYKWDSVDTFYYLPAVIMLVKFVIRSI